MVRVSPLFRISDGSLTVSGKEIGALSEDSLMKAMTYVGTGSVFFKGTVRENLLLAAPLKKDRKSDKLLPSNCSSIVMLRLLPLMLCFI